MNEHNEIPNYQDELLQLNELLERLNQAGYKALGSININIYKPGSQHVDRVETQYIGASPPAQASPPAPLAGERGVNTSFAEPPRRRELPEVKRKNAKNNFDKNTPLSALFWKSHHEELKKVLETWRPYLKGETEDVIGLNTFLFDLSQIRPSIIYLDLAHLINHGGLQSSASALATYMFQHSNLSKSANALYVQLKRYKKLCE
ncbi:MAG: hypothetical protein K6A96_08930 [Prevotella sp.]|nr:hypothetical protein [Prevotella sp.]